MPSQAGRGLSVRAASAGVMEGISGCNQWLIEGRQGQVMQDYIEELLEDLHLLGDELEQDDDIDECAEV
jgi:hypothetical protein